MFLLKCLRRTQIEHNGCLRLLATKNTTIAIVGKDMPFKVMDDDDVQPFLDRIASTPRTGQHAENTTIAIVGKDMPFKVMDDDDVQPFLDRIASTPRTGQHAEAPGGEAASHQ
uniref:RPN13_C domain-containing protein n=1 Tax=Ascaris lumbricoides TaxID=6252 RepID=A0A0M3I2R5_ASCLU